MDYTAGNREGAKTWTIQLVTGSEQKCGPSGREQGERKKHGLRTELRNTALGMIGLSGHGETAWR